MAISLPSALTSANLQSALGGVASTTFQPEIRTTKTITFTGAANLGAIGNVPIFTVSGTVFVRAFIPTVTTTLDTTGSPTIALGTTNKTTLFLAATATSNLTTSNNIWLATTATTSGLALPAALLNIVVADNIVGTVATHAIGSGAIDFDILWVPFSSGATLS